MGVITLLFISLILPKVARVRIKKRSKKAKTLKSLMTVRIVKLALKRRNLLRRKSLLIEARLEVM